MPANLSKVWYHELEHSFEGESRLNVFFALTLVWCWYEQDRDDWFRALRGLIPRAKLECAKQLVTTRTKSKAQPTNSITTTGPFGVDNVQPSSAPALRQFFKPRSSDATSIVTNEANDHALGDDDEEDNDLIGNDSHGNRGCERAHESPVIMHDAFSAKRLENNPTILSRSDSLLRADNSNDQGIYMNNLTLPPKSNH